MNRLKLFLAVLMVGFLWVPAVVAEEDWEPREDLPSIVELIETDGDFDTLEAALNAAGIADNIAVHGPFTVFAPTDAAFAKLPAGLVEDLLADEEMLTDVLLYHVVEGDIGPDVAATLREATMLNGEKVYIKIFEDEIYLNDEAKVVRENLVGMNGRVHGIDTVLIPPVLATEMIREEMGEDVAPVAGGGTILDIAGADSRLDTLVTAVAAANLGFDLAHPGTLTVLAPTDAAFARLPEEMLNDLLDDPTMLRKVLLYHVVPGTLSREDAIDTREAETVLGETLFIKVFDDEIYFNDVATIVEPDILASNGRIHVIDQVLTPPSMRPAEEAPPVVITLDEDDDHEDLSIAEAVAADARFSTLVTALDAAGLVDTLAGGGPFTVFAPTNAAFAKVPPATLNALLADPKGDLTDVLLYHVASGLLGSEEALDLTEKMMLNGDTVGIKLFEDELYLNDVSKIIIQDVATENGIIHVVDTVLIPPSE